MKKTILTSLICFVIYFVHHQTFTIYFYENLKFIWQNSSWTYDQKMTYRFPQEWALIKQIKEKTPENVTLIIPNELNKVWYENFLYPRILKNEGE